MGPVILDTNVVIYHLNGQLADPIEGDMCVSVITEIELLGYHGLTDETEFPIRQFLSLVRCIEIDSDIKKAAITMRRNSNLRLADAVIAATASVAKGILLTHDLGLLGVPTIQAIAQQLKLAP